MNKKIAFLIAILIISFTAESQNLYFIAEKSFPCTETFSLEANLSKHYINDLNILFAKDKTSALVAISTETIEVQIRGNIIIYLNDGTVISLAENGISDYVDKVSSAIYYLTDEELNKIKNSNINTIRYSLKNEYGSNGVFGGNFSASNNSKIDFSKVATKFFE